MPPRELPPAPHLDHLRRQAKALRKEYAAGDPEARRRAHAVLRPAGALTLAEAQRVVAREYGFASWRKLKAHVETARGSADAVEALLEAAAAGSRERARAILERAPDVGRASLHAAAVLGLDAEVRRHLAERPDAARATAGPEEREPLLWLCCSPFHGESPERDGGLLRSAERLLAAGADPNAHTLVREGANEYRIPALYWVTGHHDVPRIARALLRAGANPTDGESVHHAAQHFHRECLELLLAHGAALNENGTWGNTPLYFILGYQDGERGVEHADQGVRWLLEHGADPDVRCGPDRETALHLAARRGRRPEVVRWLLDHGADVAARRADGRTPWVLAKRAGFDAVATLLEEAGATPEPLSPSDELLAACGRGDADAARRLTTPALLAAMSADDFRLLPDAAADGRLAVVRACLAAGFPPSHRGGFDGTALHHAGMRGHAEVVRLLTRHGADLEARDRDHHSTPLGWTCFGADVIRQPGGDYEGCVAALLEAGATVIPAQHTASHPGVAALLRSSTKSTADPAD